MEVIALESVPPVQDSAIANLSFFFFLIMKQFFYLNSCKKF